MLKLGNIKYINDIQADEIWCIVRNMKGGVPQTDVPVYHVPELSPSQELYSWYWQMSQKGEWSQEVFDKEYTPRFIEEMKKEPARSKLMELADKCREKDIVICCFCDDSKKCHKTLVKKFVDNLTAFYCVVAGSRTFNDYELMKEHLDNLLSGYAPNVVIISGGAKGADSLAEKYADERGYRKKIFPADWKRLGKQAGFVRNAQMHDFAAGYKNRGCVCFWDGQSRGTADNFHLCKERDTQLRIVRYTDSRSK